MIEYIMKTTYQKVQQTIKFLQSYDRFLATRGKGEILEISYSGGKDSDVLLWLARQAGISYRAIYKSTTIDPPGTLKHVSDVGATILRPAKTFLQLIEEKGWPTMFRRWCCSELKEYYTAPYIATGIRVFESIKRQKLYIMPSTCRMYTHGRIVENITPIYQYTDCDIATLVNNEAISVHPLYYKEDGQFDVTRRLGCLGCPLQSDRGRSDFMQYPKLFRLRCKAILRYCTTHNINRDPYDYIMYEIFYSNHGQKKYEQTWHGLFTTSTPKQFLEDYFKIDLP